MVSDAWRTEAYCPTHLRQEHIVRVRSILPHTQVMATYQVLATLECGKEQLIVMTARNLELIKGMI